jgi:hypothetical protein
MMAPKRKPPEEVRRNILRIRLTAAERAELDETARAEWQDIATWAREQLLGLARRLQRKRQKHGDD